MQNSEYISKPNLKKSTSIVMHNTRNTFTARSTVYRSEFIPDTLNTFVIHFPLSPEGNAGSDDASKWNEEDTAQHSYEQTEGSEVKDVN